MVLVWTFLLDSTFSNSHYYCYDSDLPHRGILCACSYYNLTQNFSENKAWGTLGNSSALKNIQSPRGEINVQRATLDHEQMRKD